MTTPENPALDFNQVMDGISSGTINLTGSNGDSDLLEETEAPVAEAAPEAAVEEKAEGGVEDLKKFIESDEAEAEGEETEESESELSAAEEESEDSELEAKPSEEDIQEISVTDAKGRRKVKVDFSDREKLKKYVQLAHGGRKWQHERDAAKAELTKTQEEYTSLKSDWDKVEKAYQEKGVAGLVNLLEGREGAFDNWYEQEAKRREAFSNMSDSERRAYELEEQTRLRDQEADRLRQEYEDKLARMEAEREATETKALESKLHPSFDRYRFSGKLGDEVAEHHYDQALWNQALGNLEELPDDVEITQAMIDKEFRRVASAFRKVISKQVQDNTKKAVAKQKKSAATKAQAKVSRGIKQNSELDNLRSNIKSGNIVDSLSSFFKAGGKM